MDIGVLLKNQQRFDEAHFNLQKSLTLIREVGDKTFDSTQGPVKISLVFHK